jgi:hypothetical protein
LIEGVKDQLEENPNAQTESKEERVKMMPDTQYKKVKAELKEANARIKKLNEENNLLVMRLKKAEIGTIRLGT